MAEVLAQAFPQAVTDFFLEGGGNWPNPSEGGKFAQTFKVTHDATITRVEFYLGKNLNATGTLDVKIQRMSGGEPEGTVLASRTVNIEEIPYVYYGGLYVPFAVNFSNIAIEADEEYAIVWDWPIPTGPYQRIFFTVTAQSIIDWGPPAFIYVFPPEYWNPYTGGKGMYYLYSAGVWNDIQNVVTVGSDFAFTIYGNYSYPTTPEQPQFIPERPDVDPEDVWDFEDGQWEDNEELRVTGGGRYKNKIIFIGKKTATPNGVIYVE